MIAVRGTKMGFEEEVSDQCANWWMSLRGPGMEYCHQNFTENQLDYYHQLQDFVHEVRIKTWEFPCWENIFVKGTVHFPSLIGLSKKTNSLQTVYLDSHALMHNCQKVSLVHTVIIVSEILIMVVSDSNAKSWLGSFETLWRHKTHNLVLMNWQNGPRGNLLVEDTNESPSIR